MTTRAKTVRMPVALADRLRRSSYRTSKPQNEIIIAAVEHWLTHPYRPGCPDAEHARAWLDQVEERHRETAGP